MLIGNLHDGPTPDTPSAGDKARFYTEMFYRPLSQRATDKNVIGLTDMMTGLLTLLTHLPEQNGKTEIISVGARPSPLPFHTMQAYIGSVHGGTAVFEPDGCDPERDTKDKGAHK